MNRSAPRRRIQTQRTNAAPHRTHHLPARIKVISDREPSFRPPRGGASLRAKAVVEDLWREMPETTNRDARKRLARRTEASGSEHRLRAMVTLVRAMPGVPVEPSALDAERVESQRPAPPLLFLCTANRCRSPIAEAFLTRALRDLGLHALAMSAGMPPTGHPAPRDARAVMRRRGLDLSSHESRTVSTVLFESSDLVIGMTREHVREVLTRVPEA
jgi:hypothetical protein